MKRKHETKQNYREHHRKTERKNVYLYLMKLRKYWTIAKYKQITFLEPKRNIGHQD